MDRWKYKNVGIPVQMNNNMYELVLVFYKDHKTNVPAASEQEIQMHFKEGSDFPDDSTRMTE